jgi:hypothetical protein
MADLRLQTANTNLLRLAEIFCRHEVEFIVIGSQAETLLGNPREARDVDLCYRRTVPNLERLAGALKQIRPRVSGTPPELPLIFDVHALSLATNFTFHTPFGLLHLLSWVEPIGDYDVLLPNCSVRQLGKLSVRVIGMDDLIGVREYLGSRRDREALPKLLALKQRFAGAVVRTKLLT